MKVVFEDEKAKGVLMSNLKRLAIAEDKFNQLSVAHDMTQREMSKIRKHWQRPRKRMKPLI